MHMPMQKISRKTNGVGDAMEWHGSQDHGSKTDAGFGIMLLASSIAAAGAKLIR